MSYAGAAGDNGPRPPPSKPKSSPFGDARPREQVIAEREGKKETEVLLEQAQKEWKPSVQLTEQQYEEKKAVEAELAYARHELEKEQDPGKLQILKEEVINQERKLATLLATFEKIAIQPKAGAPRRPTYDRRREGDYPAAQAEYGDQRDGYGSFGRGRSRESSDGRGGSYGDAWGGSGGRGRSSQSECYTCGELGHFSRDCPNRTGRYGGSGGGGGGGRGQQCYSCGQIGHISRECPYGGTAGGFGGSYSRAYEGGAQYGYDDQHGREGGGSYNVGPH